jgi:hypothetical protein
MRSFFIVALLLGSAVEAETVTLDFQEFYDPGLTFAPVGEIESQGFSIVNSGTAVWLADHLVIGDLSIGVGYSGSTLTISAVDGLAFNLEAFDYAAQDGTSMNVSVVRADGSGDIFSVTSLWTGAGPGYSTYEAAGLFNNIVSFTLDGATAAPALDNFRVTSVPIPAAVWLFGSALAGLGWLKRKQTV